MADKSLSGRLAERLAKACGWTRPEWEVTLEAVRPACRRARLSLEALEEIAEITGSPAAMQSLVELLGNGTVNPISSEPWQQLREAAGYSAFDLRSWANSVLAVAEWAHAHDRDRRFQAYLDYTACCAEYAANQGARPKLTETTQGFLEEFGFDG